jgi:hypothetical protein
MAFWIATGPQINNKRMLKEDKIEADINEAKRRKEEALKAGCDALAGDIQKQLLVLQEDLKNERQRLENEQQRQLEAAAGIAQRGSFSSTLSIIRSRHRILGDDIDGPHSSAIIVGRRAVLACAHSLRLLRSADYETTALWTYLEDYWIQPSFTKYARGTYTTDNRVPLKLFKFHEGNDWALFVRADGKFFSEDEVAPIDKSLNDPSVCVITKPAVVMHCPVALKPAILTGRDFRIGWNSYYVTIQGESGHHIKYEGRDLCRGSSGGGVYLAGSTSVLGMHCEYISEAEYDADEGAEMRIAHTDKRVASVAETSSPFESCSTPPTKKPRVDSETIASLARGNHGLGSGIIICKFSRLMHYIEELK